MLTGAVELYSNHGVLIVGSTSWPELDWDDSPASADGKHVAIMTRGQVAHTRVSFWSGAMPMLGELVFDGDLDLDEYRICVGDIERQGRWTQRIGQTGPQRVVVLVDDPGHASRVHVGLNIGRDAVLVPLPSTGGPTLFSVLTSERDGLALPDERGLALDGHDSAVWVNSFTAWRTPHVVLTTLEMASRTTAPKRSPGRSSTPSLTVSRTIARSRNSRAEVEVAPTAQVSTAEARR
jgi:hypothetical protein